MGGYVPIYEYQCSSCNVKGEHLQKMSDAPIIICPACDKNTYTKLISAAGFHLKGSGWYATDFKNNSQPKPKQETTIKNETASAASATESAIKPSAPPVTANE